MSLPPWRDGIAGCQSPRRNLVPQSDPKDSQNGPPFALSQAMHPITFIALLEEMVDLKVQQQTEAHLKTTPEVAAVLHQKRETDRRRLDQIRAEMIRILTA